MKKLLPLLSLFICLAAGAQKDSAFDGHKWEAPYELSIPRDWTIERFLIPISFAPQISYKGVEDIRFTPGWAKLQSEEYWSYAFLWYLDGQPSFDAQTIASNLKAYYTGLIGVNTEPSKIPGGKIEVTTKVEKKETAAGDAATYAGTVIMLDYMQLKRITLNCIVHVKPCAEGNKTIVFHELSPKDFTHNVWALLNKLWTDFTCVKPAAKK